MTNPNFRRALVESRGDPTVFVTQPIALLFFVLAGALGSYFASIEEFEVGMR